MGMCCTKFQVCYQYGGIDLGQDDANANAVGNNDNSIVSEGWSFHVDMTGALPTPNALGDNEALGLVDAGCTVDYVEIPDSTVGTKNYGAATETHTRYCGARFGFIVADTGGEATMTHAPVYDCTEPWEVIYHTDQFNDAGVAATQLVQADVLRGMCLDFDQEAC